MKTTEALIAEMRAMGAADEVEPLTFVWGPDTTDEAIASIHLIRDMRFQYMGVMEFANADEKEPSLFLFDLIELDSEGLLSPSALPKSTERDPEIMFTFDVPISQEFIMKHLELQQEGADVRDTDICKNIGSVDKTTKKAVLTMLSRILTSIDCDDPDMTRDQVNLLYQSFDK